MELVGCWHTRHGDRRDGDRHRRVRGEELGELGADPQREGVRDPLMSTWVDKRRALMVKGTRRFYESASFSPSRDLT